MQHGACGTIPEESQSITDGHRPAGFVCCSLGLLGIIVLLKGPTLQLPYTPPHLSHFSWTIPSLPTVHYLDQVFSAKRSLWVQGRYERSLNLNKFNHSFSNLILIWNIVVLLLSDCFLHTVLYCTVWFFTLWPLSVSFISLPFFRLGCFSFFPSCFAASWGQFFHLSFIALPSRAFAVICLRLVSNLFPFFPTFFVRSFYIFLLLSLFSVVSVLPPLALICSSLAQNLLPSVNVFLYLNFKSATLA